MKSEFPTYAVAMSQDTGCIVMTKTQRGKVSVMGSLTREQSIEFAKSIVDWKETIALGVKKEVPKLTVVK